LPAFRKAISTREKLNLKRSGIAPCADLGRFFDIVRWTLEVGYTGKMKGDGGGQET
jgi:hypothetical protein